MTGMTLSDYLATNRLTQRAFAERAKLAPETINRMVRGHWLPSKRVMAIVAKATDGAVMPNDWFQPKEAA